MNQRVYKGKEWTNGSSAQPFSWDPLRDLVGMELADWFMHMYAFELEDNTTIHVYKHGATRETIHLATDGRAFDYLGDHTYCELERVDAIQLAFFRWENCVDQPDDPARQRRLLDDAMRTASAGETVPWALRPEDDEYLADPAERAA